MQASSAIFIMVPAGASSSRQQVVAAGPDSPRVDRVGNKGIGQSVRTKASAGAA